MLGFNASQYAKVAASGEHAGSTSADQLPDITAKAVNIKAVLGNSGNVYVGFSGVTVVDGSTDVTSGWELDAGEETGWLPVGNLNELYIICDNAGDDIVYMIAR
tara:strand:- start:976 stop:1287 length:312 start_codon:yes stop_codon:yes gene_type:complete